jgi:hypothetical protein
MERRDSMAKLRLVTKTAPEVEEPHRRRRYRPKLYKKSSPYFDLRRPNGRLVGEVLILPEKTFTMGRYRVEVCQMLKGRRISLHSGTHKTAWSLWYGPHERARRINIYTELTHGKTQFLIVRRLAS